MSDKETVTQLMKNGLSPSENRIRLLVERELDEELQSLAADFQKAIDTTVETTKLIADNIRKQATTDFQALTARIEEVEKRQQYEAERARLQGLNATSQLPVSPALVGLKMQLDKSIPSERQEPLFNAMTELLLRVHGAKDTAEVQRILYRASDEACRHAGKRGPSRSMVHFERSDVILGGAGLVLAGTVVGVAGRLAVRAAKNRRTTREGRSGGFSPGAGPAGTTEEVKYEVLTEEE